MEQFFVNKTSDEPVEMNVYSANPPSFGVNTFYSETKSFEIKTIPVSVEGLKIGMDRPSFDVRASPPDYQELWFDLYEWSMSSGYRAVKGIMEEMDPSLLDD